MRANSADTLNAIASCDRLTMRFPDANATEWWKVLAGLEAVTLGPPALKEISLAVGKGEFLGVMGRNGAGKSTLLRVLAGVLEPSAGRVTVLGSRAGIFELGGLGNRFLSGREYARRFLVLNGVGEARAARVMSGIQEFSELGVRFDDALITYSSGMLSRLYFSVATSVDSDVYFIDELLSVGDEHFQAKCWRRINEMRERGASGVLVTHDWSAVLKACHAACVLETGCIAREGTPEEMVQSYLEPLSIERGAANFIGNARQTFTVGVGEAARLAIGVKLHADLPVALGLSVESIGGTVGWQALLIQNFNPVATKAGQYDTAFTLPAGLLAPGRYLINRFLTSPGQTFGTREFKIYDARAWTMGSPDVLVIEGEPVAGALGLRFSWTGETA